MTTIINRVGDVRGSWRCVAMGPKRGREYTWLWECQRCGKKRECYAAQVESKRKCMGCISADGNRGVADQTLRDTRNPAYRVWHSMVSRCTKSADKFYYCYGGRGITVCPQWLASFDQFREDMGPVPTGMQIDRIDNDRGYEPGNCRWVTPTENSRNRSTSRYVEFRGQRRHLGELTKEFGVSYYLVHGRLKTGWDIESALTAPKGSRLRQLSRRAA